MTINLSDYDNITESPSEYTSDEYPPDATDTQYSPESYTPESSGINLSDYQYEPERDEEGGFWEGMGKIATGQSNMAGDLGRELLGGINTGITALLGDVPEVAGRTIEYGAEKVKEHPALGAIPGMAALPALATDEAEEVVKPVVQAGDWAADWFHEQEEKHPELYESQTDVSGLKWSDPRKFTRQGVRSMGQMLPAFAAGPYAPEVMGVSFWGDVAERKFKEYDKEHPEWSEDKKVAMANAHGGVQGLLETLQGKLLLTPFKGVVKKKAADLAKSTAGEVAEQGMKPVWSLLKGMTKTIGAESGMETFQDYSAQWIDYLGQGYWTDHSGKRRNDLPSVTEAAKVIPATIVATGALSSPASIQSVHDRKKLLDHLEKEDVNPEDRRDAVWSIYNTIKKDDPELARMWFSSTAENMEKNKPVAFISDQAVRDQYDKEMKRRSITKDTAKKLIKDKRKKLAEIARKRELTDQEKGEAKALEGGDLNHIATMYGFGFDTRTEEEISKDRDGHADALAENPGDAEKIISDMYPADREWAVNNIQDLLPPPEISEENPFAQEAVEVEVEEAPEEEFEEDNLRTISAQASETAIDEEELGELNELINTLRKARKSQKMAEEAGKARREREEVAERSEARRERNVLPEPGDTRTRQEVFEETFAETLREARQEDLEIAFDPETADDVEIGQETARVESLASYPQATDIEGVREEAQQIAEAGAKLDAIPLEEATKDVPASKMQDMGQEALDEALEDNDIKAMATAREQGLSLKAVDKEGSAEDVRSAEKMPSIFNAESTNDPVQFAEDHGYKSLSEMMVRFETTPDVSVLSQRILKEKAHDYATGTTDVMKWYDNLSEEDQGIIKDAYEKHKNVAGSEAVEILEEYLEEEKAIQKETERGTVKETEQKFDPKDISETPLPDDISGEVPPLAGGREFLSTASELQEWLDNNGDGYLYRATLEEAYDDAGYDQGLESYGHTFQNQEVKKVHSFTSSYEDAVEVYKGKSKAEQKRTVIYRVKPEDISDEFISQVYDGEKEILHIQSPKPAHETDSTTVFRGEGEEVVPDSSRTEGEGGDAIRGDQGVQDLRGRVGDTEGGAVTEQEPSDADLQEIEEEAEEDYSEELDDYDADEELDDYEADEELDEDVIPLDELFYSKTGASLWHSRLQNTITEKGPKTASVKQWLSTLQQWKNKNTLPEPVQEELEWTGLEDWLGQQEGKVSRDEVVDYLRANAVQVEEVEKRMVPLTDTIVVESWDRNEDEWTALTTGPDETDLRIRKGGPSQYDIYLGGENIGSADTLEDAKAAAADTVGQHEGANASSGAVYPGRQLAGGENYRELLLRLPPYKKGIQAPASYKSQHWDEPNVLAHVRFTERTDSEGAKTLFIEEMQSDWHQEGRKKGYRGDKPQVGAKFWANEQAAERLPDLDQQPEGTIYVRDATGAEFPFPVDSLRGRTPNAPFKTTWPAMTLKRMVRYATENGFDKVSWHATAGTIAEVEAWPGVEQDSQGWWETSGQDVTPIVERYLTRLPQIANKLFNKKAWGKAKAEKGQITTRESAKQRYEGPAYTIEQLQGKLEDGSLSVAVESGLQRIIKRMQQGESFQEAADKTSPVTIESLGGEITYVDHVVDVWSLPITPEMNDKVLGEGLPLFSTGQIPSTIEVAEEIQAEVEKEFPGQNIQVVQSSEGYPEGTEGVYDPTTGTVTLFADNLAPNRVFGVAFHELVHRVKNERGWAGVFNDESIVDEIQDKLNAGDAKWKAAEHKAALAGTPTTRMLEETITHFIADNANKSDNLWQKITKAVRAWAVKTGIKRKITDDDIMALAERAIKKGSQAVPSPSELESGLEPLAVEARKFDTAGEFVASEAKYFHGTDNIFTEFQKGRKSSRFLMMKKFDVITQGHFFTTAEEEAATYGDGNVLQVRLDIKNPLKPLSEIPATSDDASLYIKAFDDMEYILEPLIEVQFPDPQNPQKGENVIDLMGEQYVEVTDAKKADGSWVSEVADEGLHWSIFDNPEVVSRMEERGYDSAKVLEPNDDIGESIFVINSDQITTKSQLIDIFNRATAPFYSRNIKNPDKMKALIEKLDDNAADTNEKQRALAKHIQKLPISERGRRKIISQITKLSKPKTVATRNKYFRQALEIVDDYHEQINKKIYKEKILKIIKDKAQPKKVTGKPVGTIGEGHKILSEVGRHIQMSTEDVTTRVSELRAKVGDTIENLTPEEQREFYLLQTYTNLDEQTPAELAQRLEEVKGVVKSGRLEQQQALDEYRAHTKALREKTVNQFSGGKDLEAQQDKRNLATNKIGNATLESLDAFDNLQQGFETLLEKLSRFDKGETFGGVVKHFSDTAFMSTVDFENALTDHRNVVEGTLEEIYGKEGWSLWNDVRKNSHVVVPNAIKVNGVGKSLSQNQAYPLWQKIIMAPEEMAYHGYDSKVKKQLEDFMTPEIKKWAEWQVKVGYPAIREKVNPVYKRRFHVDMADIENYVPFPRDVAKAKDDEMLLDEKAYFASEIAGAMKSKVDNKHPPKIVDGDALFMIHMTQMEHFAAWSDTLREMRSVLTSEEALGNIEAFHGKNAKNVLLKYVDDMARGGKDRANIYNTVSKVTGNMAVSMIGANPTLAPKQLTSFLAYAMDMPIVDFGIGTADLLARPDKIKERAELLLKNKYMKGRYDAGHIREVANAIKNNKAYSAPLSFKEAMIFPTKVGDAGAIVLGGWAYYKHQYDNYKKTMSHEEAQDQALFDFAKTTNRNQQSSHLMQQSQLHRAGSFAEPFNMFITAPQMYYRNTATGWRNLYHGRGSKSENLKRIAISQFILPMLFQTAMSGGDPTKEELGRAALMGPLNGLFIIRDFADAAIRRATGGAIFEGEMQSPLFAGADMVLDEIPDIVQAVMDGDAVEGFKSLAWAVGGIGSMMLGVPVQPVKRWYEGIQAAVEGDTKYPVRRAMGYSKWALNETKKKKKKGGYSAGSYDAGSYSAGSYDSGN